MNTLSVHLIDGNSHALASLSQFFRTNGITTLCYSSAEDFLAVVPGESNGCIVANMDLPGMRGVALQETLAARGIHWPFIFITEAVDVPTVIKAVKSGGHNFHVRPVDYALLLGQVQDALYHVSRRQMVGPREDLQARINGLTKQERTVLSLVLAGKPNSEIALILQISPRTVEAHRSHILAHIGVDNLMDLLHVFIQADEQEAPPL